MFLALVMAGCARYVDARLGMIDPPMKNVSLAQARYAGGHP
jgi:hypothetical protein